MVIMIRVAVTGGIACGKSLAASMMDAAGVPVCDADAVAHRLIEPGTDAHRKVVDAFGSCILADDGSIDRRVLGDIVFKHEEKRQRLNALLHPAVRVEIERWLRQQAQGGARMAAAVIPLLFEADMAAGWDAVVCVACQPSLQMARLRSRGLDEAACRARLAAQMPLAEKVKRSDFTIWNDGSPDELSESVRQVLEGIEERHR
jgi:dephospho-CoA kinase